MKFSIVTPSYNRHDFLNETIESVISQKGDFEIEYIIQDGGSNDSVLNILKAWKQKIEAGEFEVKCNSLTFEYVVEPDEGMYDAINKGFAKCNGDILAWINTDDKYQPGAFVAIAEAFENYDDVDWLIGCASSFNLHGSISGFGHDPLAFSRKYIREGYYRSDLSQYGFNWLSQDAMFWRNRLWRKTNGLQISNKLASDFYLWQEFAKHADLVKINTYVAGYRFHGDQLTADPHAYFAELPNLPDLPKNIKFLFFLNKFSSRLLKLLVFNRYRRKWLLGLLDINFGELVGRQLIWSNKSAKWVISFRKIFK